MTISPLNRKASAQGDAGRSGPPRTRIFRTLARSRRSRTTGQLRDQRASRLIAARLVHRIRPCCTDVSKGATAPSWNHLRNPYEIGLPEFAHSVERFDRDCNFGHTASVFARLQGVSDDAHVATDRRFKSRAPVVAGLLLPVHPPVRIDRENMLVSLAWRCRDRSPSYGSFAWRHDKFSVRISCQDAFENASPVICAVAHE